jgi:hypothetical protein
MSCKNILIFFSLSILILSIIIYYSFDTSFEEIEIANSKAKCMDGSNYKFLFSKGFGNGTNSFYIYFEGGGFCGDNNYNPNNNDSPLECCYKRKNIELGSNKINILYRYFNKFFSRFLTSSKYFNPIFYNWNKIFIKYCDGTMHTGNNIDPIIFNNTKIYVRGEENVKSVFNYLTKNNDFSNAKNVLAVGSSAGGVAVVFYSKYIRSLLSDKTNYKVISDSGYFHHGTYEGINRMDDMMLKLQNSLKIRQTETMKNIDEKLDFFNSSNTIKYVNKLNNDYPILFLTSSLDSWAIKRLLNITCFFGKKVYDNCEPKEINIFEQYSKDVENDFKEIINKDKSKTITAFITKGFYHMFLFIGWSWNDKSYGVNEYSVQQFVHDWYYDLLPKNKRMFYDSKNVLKYKTDVYWYSNYLAPDF